MLFLIRAMLLESPIEDISSRLDLTSSQIFNLQDDLKTAGKSLKLSVSTQRMRSCTAKPCLLVMGDGLNSRTVNVIAPIFDLNLG